MKTFYKSWGLLFFLVLPLSSSLASEVDIAVVRSPQSPFFEQVYFAFAAAAERNFVTYTAKLGEEEGIGNAMRVKGVRAVLFLGEMNEKMVASLDPKVPVLNVRYGREAGFHSDDVERTVVPLQADLSANATLQMVKKIFPDRSRIGMAYNPKVNAQAVDEYRNAEQAAGFKFVLLKIDQPADLLNLVTTFKGKIDLFLLLPDVTVLKAGIAAVRPFLASQKIPLVAPSDALLQDGTVVTADVDPVGIGRQSWQIIRKMLSGQRTFATELGEEEVVITVSLSAAAAMNLSSDETLEILGRATRAGFRTRVAP